MFSSDYIDSMNDATGGAGIGGMGEGSSGTAKDETSAPEQAPYDPPYQPPINQFAARQSTLQRATFNPNSTSHNSTARFGVASHM
jgi:hypothetical protein